MPQAFVAGAVVALGFVQQAQRQHRQFLAVVRRGELFWLDLGFAQPPRRQIDPAHAGVFDNVARDISELHGDT